MTREFTCIICPNGCEISADYEIQADQSVVIHSLEGSHLQKRSRVCKTGADRSEEKHCNLRTGRREENCLLPVIRLTAPIPKASVFSMQW